MKNIFQNKLIHITIFIKGEVKNMTYPVIYDEFRDKIIELFIENELKLDLEFTKEQRREFMDNNDRSFREDYEFECKNYAEGQPNVFDNPENIKFYIMGLNFDCQMYYIQKESPPDALDDYDIDESKYPLNYEQFKKRLIEVLIKDAKRISKVDKDEVLRDVRQYIKDYPTALPFFYRQTCKHYDKLKREKYGEDVLERIFGEDAISVNTVYYWGMELDYWFFL